MDSSFFIQSTYIKWFLSVQLFSEKWVTSPVFLCVSGGEGTGPPWTELVHNAPHAGLLGAGRTGPAAWPRETLRDDPEEEEDAPTQQEEEMNRMPILNPSFVWGTSYSVMSVTLLEVQTRGKMMVVQTRQTLAMKSVPDVKSFLCPLDIWGYLLSDLSSLKENRGNTSRPKGTEGKYSAIYAEHLLMHSLHHWRIQYFSPLLVKLCSANSSWPGLSLVLVPFTKFPMFYLNLFFFSCMMFTQNSSLGILSNTFVDQKKSSVFEAVCVFDYSYDVPPTWHSQTVTLRLLNPAVQV